MVAPEQQTQPALDTIKAELAERVIAASLAEQAVRVVHQIDAKWSLRRGRNDKLFLTNGTDSAPLGRVTEQQVQGWTKKEA